MAKPATSAASPEPDAHVTLLLQSVGIGENMEQSLRFVAAEAGADRVLYLCSERSLQSGRDLAAGDPSRTEALLIGADPDDFDALVGWYRGLMRDLRVEHGSGTRLLIDQTRGTKVMSAALTHAGVAEGADAFLYGTGDQVDDRVRETSRVVRSNLAIERLTNGLQDALDAFSDGHYPLVQGRAAGIRRTLGPEHRGSKTPEGRLYAAATTLEEIAGAYAAWELFNWPAARRQLLQVCGFDGSQGKPDASGLGWEVDSLAGQAEHASRCLDVNTYPGAVAADLLENLKRATKRGAFDDAVARAYRLTELLLQARVAVIRRVPLVEDASGQPSTTKVPVGELLRIAPGFCRVKGWDDADKTVSLGLADSLHLLLEVGDPVGETLGGDDFYGAPHHWNGSEGPRGPLAGVMENRNRSLLAHGLRPMRENEAVTAAEVLAMLLGRHREHLPGQPEDPDLLQRATPPRAPATR